MLSPLNGYLCVELCEEKQAKEPVVLVPEGVDVVTSAYRLVKLISKHPDCSLEIGLCLLVPSHIVETVEINHCNYYLVHERHVVGTFSEQ